ncbi:alpha/beta fold hydrolase [Histidinibacterium lentulum]|uniref:Alpha/beta fold hydrolase n=1 Tax=Histidinibacterium lentulum TaxID=2480588 RepID=A0A3N2R4M4_9RHOB|nr:alpha/beta hydrolase [Histidinibacterium lentulum]ROU02440.1 alpha/beta fold hydrolase [Histidinibacterium lentulum]
MSAVVCLHGAALASLRWGPFDEALWPVLPGHLDAPRTTPSVAAYADAILPGLPDRVALAGHSLGGMVALVLAARLRERCRALILLDTPLSLPRWLLPRAGTRTVPVLVRVPGPPILARIVAHRTENREMRPAVVASISATRPAGLSDALIACTRFDGRPLLNRLTAPVLCLLGRRSLLTGRRETEAFGRIGAETRTFDTGHMLPFDAPDEVNPLMRAFLESHP